MTGVSALDTLLATTSRKAVAIGRNYAKHAKEMGWSVPAEPFWFFKPSTSYLPMNKGPILLPRGAEVHHEVELGVIMGRRARDVPASDAKQYIGGYVCAIDVTARNWQMHAKNDGLPWSMCKGCDTFLPYSTAIGMEAIPMDEAGVTDVELYLMVNGEMRQRDSTKHMVFHIPQLIEHISKHVTLEEGDLILTGTPEGVGPIKHGDVIKAGIIGVVEMQVDVVNK